MVAIGLLAATCLANSIAALINCSLSSSTRETNPCCNASSAPNRRPDSASSRTKLWLPTTFGKRCSPPTSAASPKSTSASTKKASCVQKRTSQAEIISTPPPMTPPWQHAITALPQHSILVKDVCQALPICRSLKACRAASDSLPAISSPAAPMSRPAVNMRPAPDNSTARTRLSCSTAPNTWRISSQNASVMVLSLLGRFSSTCNTCGAGIVTCNVS
mmetsp:Transcript_41455/g.82005  ORF Transcript_41455/g.82005 Transcript_41455/m.82005 type:complete len:218 (+) Transcript_41455:195-848(+)